MKKKKIWAAVLCICLMVNISAVSICSASQKETGQIKSETNWPEESDETESETEEMPETQSENDMAKSENPTEDVSSASQSENPSGNANSTPQPENLSQRESSTSGPESPAESESGTLQPENPAESESGVPQPESPAESESGVPQPESPAENESGTSQPESAAESESGTSQPESAAENEGDTSEPESAAESEGTEETENPENLQLYKEQLMQTFETYIAEKTKDFNEFETELLAVLLEEERDRLEEASDTGEADAWLEKAIGEVDKRVEELLQLRERKRDARETLKNYAKERLVSHGEWEQEIVMGYVERACKKIDLAVSAEEVADALSLAKKDIDEMLASEMKYPRMLSLSGSGTSELSKLSPQFQPEVFTYYFMDNRPIEFLARTMTAVVEKHVLVEVNGTECPVKSGNRCTFDIPYRGDTSENKVVLTNSLTGLSTTYVFHTFGYGVSDPARSVKIVTKQGTEDKKNLSAFEAVSSSVPVYQASTNLEKVRLQCDVSLGAGKEYRADITDKDGNVLDTLRTAAGEEALQESLLSKVLTLKTGENTLFLKCYGTYTVWEDGQPYVKEGAHVRVLHITRNEIKEDGEEDPAQEDTTLDSLQVYLNGTSGKSYVTSFDPETRVYQLTVPYEDLDSQQEINYLYMRLVPDNDGQKIKVTGGSQMYGVKSFLSMEDNGCYKIAHYKKDKRNAVDSFTVSISVTAKNGITEKKYTIQITKTGRSGMEIPDIYRDRDYYISYTNPDRYINLTLASVAIYDQNGNKMNTSGEAKNGHFYIEIENPDILSFTGVISGGNFQVWLKQTGRTPIKVIYDNGEIRFEDKIAVTLRYSTGYLKNEINSCRSYLRCSIESDRIYSAGATDAFEQAILAAEQKLKQYPSDQGLNSSQKDEVNDAVIALLAAKQTFRQSEIGKKITAFLPFPEEVRQQEVRNKTLQSELKLPSSLQAVIDGETVEIQGITWSSTPVYREQEPEGRRYHFQPILPAGYVTMEGVAYPDILVIRESEKPPILVKRTILLDEDILVQRVKVGVKKEELQFPNLEMYAVEGTGDSYGRITVPVLWDDMDGFDGDKPGTYRFHSRLDPAYDEYELYPNVSQDPMQTITIIVEDPQEGGGAGEQEGTGDETGKVPGTGGDGQDPSGTGEDSQNPSGTEGGGENDAGNGSVNDPGSGEGNQEASDTGGGSQDGSETGNSAEGGTENGGDSGETDPGKEGGIRKPVRPHDGKEDDSGNNQESDKPEEGKEKKPYSSNQPQKPSESEQQPENQNRQEQTPQTDRKKDEQPPSDGQEEQQKEEPAPADDSGEEEADVHDAGGKTAEPEEKEDGDQNEDDGPKTEWKVAELVGDTVVSHKNELVAVGAVFVLLLMAGAFREWIRKKKERKP